MRLAISGAHSTGKSTLIAAFLDRTPGYRHEPEAFELLGDDVELSDAEGPTADGLQTLLEHTISALTPYGAGDRVVFERSPVDYLAYAAASHSWPAGSVAGFLEASVPRVRRSLPSLDLIALVPVSASDAQSRADEDPQFRRRVDEALRCALLDDDFDLFGDQGSPRVVELPSHADRQLAELTRLAATSSSG